MCDFCTIVKNVVEEREIPEEVIAKSGLFVAIKGRQTGLPIFIRRTHPNQTLAVFKDAMKQAAKRLFPEMEIDEPKLDEEDHYHFYMRPKK